MRTLNDVRPDEWDALHRRSFAEWDGEGNSWVPEFIVKQGRDSTRGIRHPHQEPDITLDESIEELNFLEFDGEGITGFKLDEGKTRMDLITPEMLRALADPLTFGASKYSDNNWRKGIAYSRVLGAAMRHLTLWTEGVNIDEESGLNHLDQAMLNLGFLATFEREGRGEELDDIYGRNK